MNRESIEEPLATVKVLLRLMREASTLYSERGTMLVTVRGSSRVSSQKAPIVNEAICEEEPCKKLRETEQGAVWITTSSFAPGTAPDFQFSGLFQSWSTVWFH